MTGDPLRAVVAVLWTASDPGRASAIVTRLVEERRIARTNVLPGATSIFRWDGAVREESETLLLSKTTQGNVDRVLERMSELHSYDVPEILTLPAVAGSERYLTGVADEVTPSE
jgi:periplasmic divalent cation tolerance protein